MYNEKPFNYLTVDNMYDLGGNLQQGILDLLKNSGVKLEISNEKEFLDKCPENSYDMCVSDADHINGGENVEKILRAVRNNGIIFAHDICNEGYPSLRRYIEVAQNLNLPHYVFNEKSLSTEGCNTGFIMIINKK
jgi:predicted O-methyltransferase YrrM